MPKDQAYLEAEKKIAQALQSRATDLELGGMKLTELPESIGQLKQLRKLDLGYDYSKEDEDKNQLTALPESLGQLTQLQKLDLSYNQLTALPEWLGQLTRLQELDLAGNQLMTLPESLGELTRLRKLILLNNKLISLPDSFIRLDKLDALYVGKNNFAEVPEIIQKTKKISYLEIQSLNIESLPEWIGTLDNLRGLSSGANRLTDLPPSLAQLEHLTSLSLDNNPLNPELAAAYKQGLDAVKAYLRAKAEAQITLNEAKLILVGEGEVGKSCLLGALRGDPWEEGRPTTHGIEIKPVKVTDPDSKKEITFNGWDFGGQRVYRPTHQLFFSAPAVYLVVWKPREGSQQGLVKEWIELIKRREPTAKILVVATHGGPKQRKPYIDRQELWDLFGKDTVLDFFHVDNKPDKKGNRRGIKELKKAIAHVAAQLPEMGRSVPKSWQEAREALQKTKKAYLPFEEVIKLCRKHKMDDEQANLFVAVSHRLGHLIHYEYDPTLRDLVVLKPDWLATAISLVLDDEETDKAHGLVRFSRLGKLWNDTTQVKALRYPAALHGIFLRLMERFDLSYRVADPSAKGDADPQSLIAQLVPDTRPEKDLVRAWPPAVASGDMQQVQICRIVDDKGQSANAEGLFYQLIVRLHKYSLGRANYNDSVHWQRGLLLDDDYNGRALLEHVGNDVRITVRAPYPERFLSVLTSEIKWLVDDAPTGWRGLHCDVMVPCIEPCGKHTPGTGLFEVSKLIDSKRRQRPEYPCPVCNEWQDIDCLLRNAPAARPIATGELITSAAVFNELRSLRRLLIAQHGKTVGRFDNLDAGQRELLSKADASYTNLLQILTDEAKEGPRLFSLVPVNRTSFNPKKWVSAKFRLTLWCEHSRKPLPAINGKGSEKGVYELELQRDWVKKAAPVLKFIGGTLRLVLPVASSATDLILDDTAFERIEEELDFGQKCIEATIEGGEKIEGWFEGKDLSDLEHGEKIPAQGATLRELHALLKAKDPPASAAWCGSSTSAKSFFGCMNSMRRNTNSTMLRYDAEVQELIPRSRSTELTAKPSPRQVGIFDLGREGVKADTKL